MAAQKKDRFAPVLPVTVSERQQPKHGVNAAAGTAPVSRRRAPGIAVE